MPRRSRRLTGHSHFVQDVALSSDGQFALSGSWDGELRLWDLATGTTARRFVGHTKDVLSVAFSLDNRQIVSASRDKSIRLWNTLGECKYTIQEADAHTEWVSCIRFNPNALQPTIVSASWDKTVKVWNLTNCKLRATLAGHNGYVNTVAVSPDGSLCASGGKDGVILLWDLAEGKKLYSLDAGNIIHALCFSPNRYWLCAAIDSGIKIWDLESKTVVEELKVDLKAEADLAEGASTANKTKDGQDTDDSKQSIADMTVFVQNLLQQMQARFQTMSESIVTKIDEMGSRIGELEQSIDQLRAEIGAEGSPSPSAAARPKAEETKDDDVSA